MLGVHGTGRLDLDFFTLFNREARIIPSLGYCAHEGGREMDDAAAMLAADPGIADALITHRFRSRMPHTRSASRATNPRARSGWSLNSPATNLRA